MFGFVGGRSQGLRPEQFDQQQLRVGMRVEMEHTNSPRIARRIAMDHLTEDADYYKKLSKIHDGKNLIPSWILT